MLRSKQLLPLVAASPFLCLTAQAQTSGDSVATLGEVVVRAGATGPLTPTALLTSVDILGADKIDNQNVANSWELIGQLPGIQLTETRMGAESGKATFRAFNGEGYINGIKVLIDGIPSNVNSGNQRFVDMIFPLETDYIEVVRGTNDPRYGLHNIGGNINFGTRQGGHYTDARLSYGSDATREVQLALGREADGFAQNYFVAHQASNGSRHHAQSDKYVLGGKWFMNLAGDTVKAGLVARLYSHTAEEPGFMTAQELAQDRRQSAAKNAHDGDDREMRHLSAHMDWQVTPTLFLSNKLYFNHYNDERRVTFTDSQAPSLANGPRQRRVWDEDQTGLLSTLTWRAGKGLVVDGGINVERQRNNYQRYRYPFATPTDFNQPGAVSNNDDYTLNNVGAYVQAVVQATDRLKLVPGMRVDRFTGHTRLNTGAQGSLQDYGWINQPKLSMVYTLTDELNVYANWGRTFQILTGSRAPAYLTSPSQAHFSPSINTGQEVGMKFKPARHTELRLAWWQQDATDEVANMPATGTTVGLGQTHRQGLDLQGSTRLGKDLTLWASHSLQQAKVTKAFLADGTSLAGKEVFSTPRHVSNVGMEYRATPALRLGLQGRAQDSYYIDSLNAKGKFGGFVLLDANLRYELSKAISVDLQLKNLADRRYVYAWDDTFFWPAGSGQAMFSPGTERAGFIALNFRM